MIESNGKFIESFDVDEWEIETEDGFKPITHVHKTKKYKVYILRTQSFELKCADEHIVIGRDFKEIYVKDLQIDDELNTINGLEKVVEVIETEDEENMYDLTIDSENHTFFTGGILSHNSTIATIYLVWYALFNASKTIAVLANKEKTAKEILRRIKFAYEGLPKWIQQGVTDAGWSETKIVLENNSRIISASTASSAIRGESISQLFLDEFAFVPGNVAEEFMASVYPTISSGKTSKIIICSTPCGMNQFYHIYRGAIKGENNFRPVKINWWEVPGRDDKWKDGVIKDIGIVKWNQEYAARFLGSSKTLIDPDLLERMGNYTEEPIDLQMGDLLLTYEKPIEGTMYILGVDSSKGVGGDFSVIQVLKINDEHDIDQVAVYRSNTIEPHNFSQIVISLSEYYNKAYCMIENNDVGGQVADAMWFEFEFDRILNCDKKGIGIRSTRKSKLAGNMLLKRYCENGWLNIRDKRTIYELTQYEEVSPDIFQANSTEHDDCVTSLLWGVYFLSTVFFDGKDISVKKIDNKFLLEKEDLNDDKPIIFFDNEDPNDEDGVNFNF